MLLLLVAIVAVAPSLAEIIDRAASRAGVSHKELAYAQGISPAQWSRQVHGEPSQHVSLGRLAQTPARFRCALLDELVLAWGGERPVTAREVLDLIRPLVAQFAVPQQEERCA